LEAFRTVYLGTRVEKGEDEKADKAIRAFVIPDLEPSLTPAEAALLGSIKTIPGLDQLRGVPIKPGEGTQPIASTAQADAAANVTPVPTTAAIAAADAAANTVPNKLASTATPDQPQNFAPPMTGTPTPAPAAPVPNPAVANVLAQRPSVEPITPVPGSPAVQNGTPFTRPVQEATAVAPVAPIDTVSGAEEKKTAEVEVPTAPTNAST